MSVANKKTRIGSRVPGSTFFNFLLQNLTFKIGVIKSYYILFGGYLMTKKVVSKFRKVTLNIPMVIYKQLEARCNEFGTNTTTEILSLIRLGIQQEQAIQCMPDILKAYNNEIKNSKR